MVPVPEKLKDPKFAELVESIQALGDEEAKIYFKFYAKMDYSPEGCKKYLVDLGVNYENGELTEPYRIPDEYLL